MSRDQWRAVIDVNLTGVFLCGRAAARIAVPVPVQMGQHDAFVHDPQTEPDVTRAFLVVNTGHKPNIRTLAQAASS